MKEDDEESHTWQKIAEGYELLKRSSSLRQELHDQFSNRVCGQQQLSMQFKHHQFLETVKAQPHLDAAASSQHFQNSEAHAIMVHNSGSKIDTVSTIAPKQKKQRVAGVECERPEQSMSVVGPFAGVRALFVEGGVSRKRLQVWKSRMVDLGGKVYTSISSEADSCTHVLAADQSYLQKRLNLEAQKKTHQLFFLKYDWVEDCLKKGNLLPHDPYLLLNPSTSFDLTFKDAVSENCTLALMPAEPLVGSGVSHSGQENSCHYTALEQGKSYRSGYVEVEHPGIAREVKMREKASSSTVHEESKLQILHNAPEQERAEETSTLEKGHERNLQNNTDPPLNLNSHLTGPLLEMWHIYEDVFADEWRAFTYKKAVNKIEKLPFKLNNAEELKVIEGIGGSIIDKIKEILSTGTLKKLRHVKADPKVQTIRLFASVWGIGPKQAQKFYAAGYRNVKDLLQDSSLTRTARIGVTYFEDIVLRIPREEVADAEKFVQAVVEDAYAGTCARVTGSFRRGHATCGDIDVLVTHLDGYSHAGLLLRLVRILKNAGFILDGLNVNGQSLEENQVNSKEYQDEVGTFMGICQLPHKPCRRLDIKVYPKAMYAFALIYFTGNDVLNRKIRYHAQMKGYKLSDRGLFLSTGKGSKARTSEVSIPCETEEEVFHKLGLPYPEPHERNW
ncbi:hypothetical protein O6H91_05G103000 [Diphasiastrum complanatum]|uniref:Uncharacterized protein n=1 Tax=Diphasiastrum complanatum TaxID=34168 RepID=A0ACC2DRX5_DIPCM|nr:hypothetical protein O6H91_05G103000 [Diphasiastrum complanatum]